MRERICYNCFSQLTNEGNACPRCGYDPTGEVEKYPLALKPGSILNGRYIIGRVLGQGGFGITYVAQDVQTDGRVAIKEYFPETMATRTGTHSVAAFTGQRAENFTYGMQCFLSEAQTLAQFIGVENIVCVHSYFEENGTGYFVMDYVDGVSFQTYLRQRGGKISWEEAKTILVPVMDALSFVHSKGIIHRDIAPDNIYITYDGTVKLLDFGAARYSLGDRSRSLDVVLKAGYAPMEQYTRRGRQGAYTDVYAMAATFYYALTGHLPPEAVERMEEDMLVLPSSYGARLPEEAEDAIEKGLAVRASERYQTMEQFRQVMTADGYIPGTKIIPERPRFQSAEESGHVASGSAEKRSGQVSFTTDTDSVRKNTDEAKKKEDPKAGFTLPNLKFTKKHIAIGAAVLAVILVLAMVVGGRSGDEKKENGIFSLSKKEDKDVSETRTVNELRKITEYNANNTVKNITVRDYFYNSDGKNTAVEGRCTGEDAYDFVWEYDYDADGNRTVQRYYRDGELNSIYEYSDFLNGDYQTMRMTLPESNSTSTSKYFYDANGNMTRSTITAETYNSEYAYTYDADGNQLTSHYEFYYRGELSSISDTVYTYDSNGDRISSEVTNYDEYGNMESRSKTTYTYEYDSDDHLLREMIYRDDGTYSVYEYERVEVVLGVETPRSTQAPREETEPVSAQSAVKPRKHPAQTIAVGLSHSVGLKENGTVITAGYGGDERCNVSSWKNIISVSSQDSVTVGLRSDGTVVATGKNDKGQCDVSGWKNIVQISTSGSHTAGLRSDGTVVAVGQDVNGCQSDVSKWEDIVAIDTGLYRTFGLKSDGTVVSTDTTKVGNWRNIIQISVGSFHVVGLMPDGTVVAAGTDNYGQCDVSDWTDIVKVVAGDYTTFGIKADGSVVSTGMNDNGQCNVSSWRNIVDIAGEYMHTVGLRADGTMVATGSNNLGQCNVSQWENIWVPEE